MFPSQNSHSTSSANSFPQGLEEAAALLMNAAEAGDTDAFYNLLRQHANLLEYFDNMPFADTPLHIAASSGQIEFAMEILNLKASFARKLNQDGFSPMHLALKNNNKLMVLLLVDSDSGLVRVKGRKGMTPLHFAAESGNSYVLSVFYEVCPESIKDVTYQGDTALHIAVEHHHVEALQVLLGWINRSMFIYARFWGVEILNWKNQRGNTVLHVAAITSQPQAVKILLKVIPIKLNIMNSEGLSAIDIIKSQTLFNDREITRFRNLRRFREFCCSNWFPSKDTENGVEELTTELSMTEAFIIKFHRSRKSVFSTDRRNVLLVVDTLIATITYQAALSPPGGVWQGTADINSSIRNNIMHVNNVTTTNLSGLEASPPRYVGSSVMGSGAFALFWLTNTFIFSFVILRMHVVGFLGFHVISSLIFSCYAHSMSVISPTKHWSQFNLFLGWGFLLVSILQILIMMYIVFTRRFSKRFLRPRSRCRQSMRDREEWWQ